MQIGILEPLDFSTKALDLLKDIGSVELFDGDNLGKFLKDKTTLFIRLNYKIDVKFLDQSPKLKYICTPTTGLNHIDSEEVNRRGIKIISLRGEVDFLKTIRATPEHTFGLMLALLRNYRECFLTDDNDLWNRDVYKGHEIYGKTAGIIGLGRVGSILKRYLEAFGANVIYYDTVDKPYEDKKYNIEDLVFQSDIIFLCASYTKENEKMIDKNIIDKMKSKYFINTARGELVDEEYLMEKIEQDHFLGVALDVIDNETDFGNNRLRRLIELTERFNLIITPHIGGATYESMWKTEVFIANKLIRILK